MRRPGVRRLANALGATAGAVGLLAVASYVTTQEDWDGGFRRGEYRVAVQDREGRPVPGAAARWFHDTEAAAAGPDGRVALVRPGKAIQFGGRRWRLFWAVPMGDRPPPYAWEVTAPGFRPRRVTAAELWEAPGSATEPTTKWARDPSVELPVYEVTVTLDR